MPLPFFKSSFSFNPANDIPSLDGRVIFVTGGNAGLGKQSIIELAKHNPSQIWLAARSPERAQAAVADIKKQVPTASIRVLQLDLASLDSIKKAAKAFLLSESRLDILMLNAGIMATPEGTTAAGYETQFGTNHVGHALLTNLLLPTLIKTASYPKSDVRIIVLSSKGHNWVPEGGIQFDTLKSNAKDMTTWNRYGQSKLANILYAKELAKRYPQLTVVAVHPGTVDTDLSKSWADSVPALKFIGPIAMPIARLSLLTIEDGAKSQLWAATSKGVVSGEYYEPVGVTGKGSKLIEDTQLAEKLWNWTESELATIQAQPV